MTEKKQIPFKPIELQLGIRTKENKKNNTSNRNSKKYIFVCFI